MFQHISCHFRHLKYIINYLFHSNENPTVIYLFYFIYSFSFTFGGRGGLKGTMWVKGRRGVQNEVEAGFL